MAGVLVISACSSGPGADAPRRTPHHSPSPTGATDPGAGTRGARLDCNAIGTEAPGGDVQIVLGRVAVPSPRAAALQASRDDDANRPVLTYFAKRGLGFKVGTSWELRVPAATQAHLRLGWGSPGRPNTVVLPPASSCALSSSTGWVWYPGGYLTDRPGCYPVVVVSGSQRKRVTIGVGAPCPGQRPPPAPTAD